MVGAVGQRAREVFKREEMKSPSNKKLRVLFHSGVERVISYK